MSLPLTFVSSLEILTPKQIVEAVNELPGDRKGSIIELEHELKPADLFCYLEARFGPPNGIQNFLRSDESDNLIHWDWTLRHPEGIISFLGLNFRTEVLVLGRAVSEEDGISLVEQIKSDFKAHGLAMKTVRDGLERWTEFVNPYQRLRGAVDRLVSSLDEAAATVAWLDRSDRRPDLDRLSGSLLSANDDWMYYGLSRESSRRSENGLMTLSRRAGRHADHSPTTPC